MSNEHPTQPLTPRAKLEQATELAKAGDKSGAARLLREIVALQPVNQAAWLWLSAVADTKTEAESALALARRINPAHPSLSKAEKWVAHRFSTSPPTKKTTVVRSAVTATSPPVRPRSQTWFRLANAAVLGLVGLALAVGLVVLLLGLFSQAKAAAQQHHLPGSTVNSVQAPDLTGLELAQNSQDWSAAVAILERAHQQLPDSAELSAQLANAYLQQGITLRSRGFVAEALTTFESALALAPRDPELKREQRLASSYLAGTEAYQAGQWPAAINHLEGVWRENSNYGHVRDLLYSANYNDALAQQAAGDLTRARRALEAAMRLRPDLAEPRRLMAELEFVLAPETPLSKPISKIEDRVIVVGIAEQKMFVYDGNRQVFNFVISTGEPGRETAIGEFEIQNKIDVAYASTWNLDMPYWMGIYWAGPLQNGIHALPIVKHNGYKLWDGYLGQRVSYGCVILSDEDAATLYDWTEVGTKVKIVSSLTNWLAQVE